MIAIFYTTLAPGRALVLQKHFKPERLTDEQKAEAIMVESEPEAPIPVKGKDSVLFINPDTKEMWYEGKDRSLTQEELLAEISEKLTQLIEQGKHP